MAVGGPTRRSVGGLPSIGAVSLTSNSDINRAGRRHAATSSDDRRTYRRRPKGRALIELLKRWLPDNQRQRPAGAGHQCAAVLGEKEQGGPCPIGRINQPCAHGPAIFPDELHCSFQPKRFESVHPHALKTALEDSGMLACGLCTISHPVGGAAAEGGQSITDASSSPANSSSSTCRSMVPPVWVLR